MFRSHRFIPATPSYSKTRKTASAALTNFAGWFVVSLLAFRVLRKKFEANQTASLTGLSIVLFFMPLALARGDALVALPGFALCLTHILLSGAMRRRA